MSDQLKYKVMKNNILGRYLVANEPLKEGSLIFTDVPFVVGPKPDSLTVCLGCHKIWNGKYHCSACAWPCCDEKCEKSPIHHEYECKVFAESSVPFQFIGDVFKPCLQYDCITPLRMLLAKEKDPTRWENEVTVMEDHNEDRRKFTSWETDDNNITKYLRGPCKLDERFSEELIQKVCGILEVNSVETPLHHGPNIRGIYPRVAIMSHNCVPTISHIIISKDNNSFFVEIRAARNIDTDEKLELSYTHVIGCTLQRRAHLRRSKFFDCVCNRCADPTELGTQMSTIKCNKCDTGMVLACNPLDDQSIWKCSDCDYTTTSETVLNVISLVDREISKAEKMSMGKDLIDKKEQDLKWYCSLLHPKHAVLIALKYFLARSYGSGEDYSSENISVTLLQRKFELCQEILEILSVVSPGHTRMKGIVLYEMHIPMVVLAQKDLRSGKITSKAYHEKISEAGKALKEAAEILMREDEKSNNGLIGKLAMKQYKELSDHLNASI